MDVSTRQGKRGEEPCHHLLTVYSVNDARAMRVAEIMNDFRTIQHKISQYRVDPSQGEYHLAGYGILRQCHAEAQAVLATHFDPGAAQTAGGSAEQTKRQLQRYAQESVLGI